MRLTFHLLESSDVNKDKRSKILFIKSVTFPILAINEICEKN